MYKVHCPICDREIFGNRAEWPEFPFCSPRCRQIDLGRWLGEVYRIPISTPEVASPTSDSLSPPDPVEFDRLS
jgi:endogenous inhibitor of DNA gyrase (YacG/DUF329 family)